MGRRSAVMVAGCLVALLVAPTVLCAAGAQAPNPLVRAAARETLSNPLVRQAIEEGRVAPTPAAALEWQKLQAQRRENLARAAAKRQQTIMNQGASGPSGR